MSQTRLVTRHALVVIGTAVVKMGSRRWRSLRTSVVAARYVVVVGASTVRPRPKRAKRIDAVPAMTGNMAHSSAVKTKWTPIYGAPGVCFAKLWTSQRLLLWRRPWHASGWLVVWRQDGRSPRCVLLRRWPRNGGRWLAVRRWNGWWASKGGGVAHGTLILRSISRGECLADFVADDFNDRRYGRFRYRSPQLLQLLANNLSDQVTQGAVIVKRHGGGMKLGAAG